MVRRWVELSQPWYNGMAKAASLDSSFSTARGTKILESGPSETSHSRMNISVHLGTHIDGARHFIGEGQTIDAYPLERFIGPAVVWDVRQTEPVALTSRHLRAARPAARPGDAALLYTGWADRFRDPSYDIYPYLSPDAADYIIQQGIRLVGTDTPSPDLATSLHSPEYRWPAHGRLLGHDILIIEHLGLGLKQVLGQRITLVAAPMRIQGSEASPITALALVEE